MIPDVNCVLADLPHSIKAFTRKNNNFSYTIVLNSRYTHEQHIISYQHELEHIKNKDYEKKCGADVIEFWAHQ